MWIFPYIFLLSLVTYALLLLIFTSLSTHTGIYVNRYIYKYPHVYICVCVNLYDIFLLPLVTYALFSLIFTSLSTHTGIYRYILCLCIFYGKFIDVCICIEKYIYIECIMCICTNICMHKVSLVFYSINQYYIINALIFYVYCLCHIGCVYVFYVGHVDRVVYTKPFFHCNILSKHHHYYIIITVLCLFLSCPLFSYLGV
jgi:hypothetical protein